MENTIRSLRSLTTILPETLVPAGVATGVGASAPRPRTSKRASKTKSPSRARTRTPTAAAAAASARPVSIFNGIETIPNAADGIGNDNGAAGTVAALFGAPTNAAPRTPYAADAATAPRSMLSTLSNALFTQPAQASTNAVAAPTPLPAGSLSLNAATGNVIGPSSIESDASPASTGVGVGGWFSWSNILIVVLLLALLGINVFVYLAQGTAWFAEWMKWAGGEAADTSGAILSTAKTGAKATVGAVAGGAVGAVKGAMIGAQKGAAMGSGTSVTPPRGNLATTQFNQATSSAASSYPPPNWTYEGSDDALQRALNDASASVGATGETPQPVEGTNSTGGWCFVGEMYPSGVRTCAKVGVNDTCMSGQVFPTQDICVNPALRA